MIQPPAVANAVIGCIGEFRESADQLGELFLMDRDHQNHQGNLASGHMVAGGTHPHAADVDGETTHRNLLLQADVKSWWWALRPEGGGTKKELS